MQNLPPASCPVLAAQGHAVPSAIVLVRVSGKCENMQALITWCMRICGGGCLICFDAAYAMDMQAHDNKIYTGRALCAGLRCDESF